MFKLPRNLAEINISINFPGHLYIKDLEGCYLGANANFIKFLKLHSAEELIGKTDFQLISQHEAQAIYENDQKVLKEGKCLSFEEIITDDQGVESVYLSQKSLLYDRENSLAGIICTSLEVTSIIQNRREFEKQAIEFDEALNKNRYMDSILWRLPEQFYWMDTQGRVIACNEKQAALFGMKRHEFVGKNIFDLAQKMGWDIDIAKTINAHDKYVIETGKPIVVEENFELKGTSKTYLSYKNPLFDSDNKLIGIFGVSIDITDRKKMEVDLLEQKRKAEAANVAKTTFLMNMSHDIRTPFTGIIGNADLLLHMETVDQKKEMLKEIMQSSQYLLDLLNGIIDIAQLEDKNIVELHSFDFRESLQKIITLIKPLSTQKSLYFSVNISSKVPQFIYGNQQNVERILLNLLSNAVKFTHKGGITLDVSIKKSFYNRSSLVIKVKDTGIGIPRNQLDKIFEKFSRLSPSYKQDYKGSGLGLWIVNELVEQIKGKIEVKSVLSKGTTFTLTLDYLGSSPYLTTDAHSDGYPLPQYDHIKNVLVVEDDAVARKIARAVLGDFFKANVECATCGKDAIEMVKNSVYDFVLMDIGLPDISGFEVAEILKNSTDLPSKPVIIGLSAHAWENVDRDGMRSVLAKPLTYELCHQIARLLMNEKASD